MIQYNGYVMTEMCRRHSRRCVEYCRRPQGNCNRLSEWVELHGPEEIDSRGREFYSHWPWPVNTLDSPMEIRL